MCRARLLVRTLHTVVITVLLVLAGALATARATRLIVADRITQPVRTWVVRRWPAPPGEDVSLPAYLVHCPWCVSIWVGLPVAVLVVALTDPLHPTLLVAAGITVLLWLAYSHLTGLLAGLEQED